jgi:hypothetical protein
MRLCYVCPGMRLCYVCPGNIHEPLVLIITAQKKRSQNHTIRIKRFQIRKIRRHIKTT